MMGKFIKHFRPQLFLDKIKDTKLLRVSFITFWGWLVGSIANFYIYFLLLRYLNLSTYGTYVSLLTIAGFLSIFATPLNLYFVKVGSYLKHSSTDQIRSLLAIFFLRIIVFILIVGFIFLFLKINGGTWFLLRNIFFIFFVLGESALGLLSGIAEGLLKGLQKFTQLSVVAIVSSGIKLFLILFVLKTSPALNTLLLIILINSSATYSLYLILVYRSIRKLKKFSTHKTQEVISMPNFGTLSLMSLFTSGFITTDIVLMQHFISSDVMGLYVAEMALAKIILYVHTILVPIMYALVSETIVTKDFTRGKRMGIQTLFISLSVSFVSVFLLKFFSQFIFNGLLHKSILVEQDVTWLMGIFIGLYCMGYTVVHYFLSKNEIHVLLFLGLANLLQIILISFYHASLVQIVFDLIIVQVVLLVLIVSLWLRRKNNRKFL